MTTIAKEFVLGLSVPERIQLVEDIWDTILDVPESITLTNKQKAELDIRLKAYEKDPDEGSSWEEVRKRIRHKQ
jgi:putative addiction module component (TIGR02574 family)